MSGRAAGLEEFELAARLIGASRRALEQLGGRIYPADKVEHERTARAVRQALGPERYAALVEEGREISLDEAVALALGDRPCEGDPMCDPVATRPGVG